MGSKTHLVGAVAASLAASQLLGFTLEETALAAAGAVAGGKAPDIDRVLDDGPDHRSITHSVVVAGGGVLALAALLWSAAYLGVAALGFAAGYLSHLFLDAMTPAKVFVLGPGGPRLGVGLFKSGGLGELGVMAALAVATAVLIMGGGYV